MPRSGMHLERPVAMDNLLSKGLDERPDELALVSMHERWTWRELDRDADRLAGNLLAVGFRPGDRIASLLPNRCATEVFYIGCIRAGLIAVPLNYRYMAPEIDHALAVSEAVGIVAHAERDSDIASSKLARSLPLGMISYGAEDARPADWKT